MLNVCNGLRDASANPVASLVESLVVNVTLHRIFILEVVDNADKPLGRSATRFGDGQFEPVQEWFQGDNR